MSFLADPHFIDGGFSARRKFEEANDDRDNIALHGSDLSKCAREIWARRNGMAKVRADDNTYRKWGFGLDFEGRVHEALYATREHKQGEMEITYQYEVKELMGFPIVGHPDFILTDVNTGEMQVVEVKTTTFYPKSINGKKVRVPDREAQLSYRIQAATYAMAVKAKTFRVIVACRDSGLMAEFVHNTEDYVQLVMSRYKLMAETTAPGMPEPKKQTPMPDTYNVRDGKSWACRYCAHAKCENNENPAALDFELDLVELP